MNGFSIIFFLIISYLGILSPGIYIPLIAWFKLFSFSLIQLHFTFFSPSLSDSHDSLCFTEGIVYLF